MCNQVVTTFDNGDDQLLISGLVNTADQQPDVLGLHQGTGEYEEAQGTATISLDQPNNVLIGTLTIEYDD